MNIENRKNAELVILKLLEKCISKSNDIERIMKSVHDNKHCIPMRYVHCEILHLLEKIDDDDRKLINELLDIYG